MSQENKRWDKPKTPRYTIFSRAGEDSIDSPGYAWEWMAAHWELPHALVTGTLGMREFSHYLPQGQLESDDAYTRRRSRSFLLNAYRDAVNMIAAKPFQKAVTLSPETPDGLVGVSDNVDMEGRGLTQFAHDWLWHALNDGIVHCLVDFPVVDRKISLAEEREMGLRPFWVMVPAWNLIGWKTARVGGREVLTQVRIYEEAVEEQGTWGEVCVDRIRVFTLTRKGVAWETHRRDRTVPTETQGEYSLDKSGLMRGVREIPLVTFYANRRGFMQGTPVLEDLAWLNLAHWQSYSQQRTYLDTARVTVPVAAGFSEDEIKNMMEVGRKGIRTNDPSAKFYFAESAGNALNAGRQDLKDLEDAMRLMKMRPLMLSPGDRTATEVVSNSMDTHASLIQIVRNEEKALRECMRLTAAFSREELGETRVNISDDFATLDGASSQDIREMMMTGLLSKETGWEELRRRGILSDDFSPEMERDRLQREDFELNPVAQARPAANGLAPDA